MTITIKALGWGGIETEITLTTPRKQYWCRRKRHSRKHEKWETYWNPNITLIVNKYTGNSDYRFSRRWNVPD
jgi:hypothetical protein